MVTRLGQTHRWMLATLFASGAALCAVPLGAAQQGGVTVFQAPPPGALTAASKPAGAATVSGQIVAADNGAPVKRARVSLSLTYRPRPPAAASGTPASPSAAGSANATLAVAGGSSPGQYEAETDQSGRFEFTGLPAGVCSLMVMPEAGYGRPDEPEVFEVAGNQTVTRTIRLERTGVISGHVFDESGDAVAKVSVSALRWSSASGVRRLQSAGSPALTNDLGQYRVFDLTPGAYVIGATSMMYYGSGRVDAALRMGFVPTFYPGSAVPADASPVDVRSGQDSPGIDVTLQRARLGTVSGTAMDSSGRPLSTQSSVMVASQSDWASMSRGGQVRDGTFGIPNIPPGDYVLVVWAQMGDGPSAAREGAYLPVSVNGDEVQVAIQTNPGATIAGRVSIAGSGGRSSAVGAQPAGGRGGAVLPAGQSGVRVMALPVSRAMPMVSSDARPAAAADDGTFQLTGVRGPVRIDAFGGSAVLKSVTLDGRDITGMPIEFTGTERVEGLEIVLTRDVGSMQGNVLDGNGEAAQSAWVIAIPEDASRWFPSSPFVRVTRVSRVSSSQLPEPARPVALPGQPPLVRGPGAFSVGSMLTGRYWVAAVGGREGPPTDAATLETLRSASISVVITAGTRTTVELRLSPDPRLSPKR